MASVSTAARESFFGSIASLVSSQERSFAVRNAQLVADVDEVDAAWRVFDLQLAQQAAHVGTAGQTAGERLLVERLGSGEQQRLEQPQFLRPRFGGHFRLLAVFLERLDPQLGQHTHQRILPLW